MVGDDVVITVLAVKGGRIQIGIDAPRTMAIHREPAPCVVKDSKHGTTPAVKTGYTGLFQGNRIDE
jgi:carbon storage regulator